MYRRLFVPFMSATVSAGCTKPLQAGETDIPPRQTLDGEGASDSPRLHEGKQELLQQFVQRSRRWSIADPQVSITRSRRELDVYAQYKRIASPAGFTWAPRRECDSAGAEVTLSRPGFDGQQQAPSAASAVAHRRHSGTPASDTTSERTSAASESLTLQAALQRSESAMEFASPPGDGLTIRASQHDTKQLRGQQDVLSPYQKMAAAAWSMKQTLSTLRKSPLSSPVKNGATLRSMLRSGPPGAPESPIRALYSDDKQLQAFNDQSEDAVLHQLMDWTSQVLQRLLTAAERATRKAREELETAVKELAEERELCSEAQRQAENAQRAAQKADADRAAVQVMLDKEQTRIAAMREDIGARRARLDELQTTYAAKREMIAEAQCQWSKRSASCSTQVALGLNGSSSNSEEHQNSNLGGTLRRAMGELGTLFSPKSKSQSNNATVFQPDHSGPLQVQMLPCCSTNQGYPDLQEEREPDPLESQGRVLTAYNTDQGAPLLTHGMEFPPEEAMRPGEMIVERLN